MEICLIGDTVIAAASQGLGFVKSIYFASGNNLFLCDSSSEQQSYAGFPKISAAIFPVDAVAPPPVKPNYLKVARRTLARRTRRTKRRSLTGGGPEDGEEGWFLGDAGGGDGPFGAGGGGRGWNFDRYGWSNWDEPSPPSPSDPAFDFVYEVVCWIALSNCLHFAFKKVVRIVVDGTGDAEREKVPMRFPPIC